MNNNLQITIDDVKLSGYLHKSSTQWLANIAGMGFNYPKSLTLIEVINELQKDLLK